MPSGVYEKLKCYYKKTKEFVPTEHQKKTLEYFISSPYKGLLLYHQLGAGKTCTSILIADTMVDQRLVDKVYILTTGTMRQTWLTEYCKTCGKGTKRFYKRYVFVTYNYRLSEEIDFNGSLVIIDEVHLFINGVKNFSKNPTLLYDKLLVSNCRILALSGTPLYQAIYEFPLLGRLLKTGLDFPEIRENGEIKQEKFMRYFETIDGVLRVKNLQNMKERLKGIISYYAGAGKEFVPEILYQEPLKIQMSEEQEKNYWIKALKERSYDIFPPLSLRAQNPELYKRYKMLFIMARKKMLTRQALNFYYIGEEGKMKDALVVNGGWIDNETLGDGKLKIQSPKMVGLLVNIVAHINQKHAIFTTFKTKAGADLMKALLTKCGITAEIFSGELDDQKRYRLLTTFNSADNRYGDILRVMIITEAGAEGISLADTRHFHIFESSPKASKIRQAIGRAARFRSHINLPENERNVKVWRYWSIASPNPITITILVRDKNGNIEPRQKTITKKETMDEILYTKGEKSLDELEMFLSILKQSSVTQENDSPMPIGNNTEDEEDEKKIEVDEEEEEDEEEKESDEDEEKEENKIVDETEKEEKSIEVEDENEE